MKQSAAYLLYTMGAAVLLGIVLVGLAKGGFLSGVHLEDMARVTVQNEHYNY